MRREQRHEKWVAVDDLGVLNCLVAVSCRALVLAGGRYISSTCNLVARIENGMVRLDPLDAAVSGVS